MPFYNGYRGQFHLLGEKNVWDAAYYFDREPVFPGESTISEMWFSPSLKEYGKNLISSGTFFEIREGDKVVAMGKITDSKFNKNQ